MNDKIFVSYSFKDEKTLQRVFESLKNQNYQILIRNKNDNYDEKYAKYIEPLLNSKITICFVTQNYVNDDYCMSDLVLCKNNKIAIVFVIYEDNINTKQLQNSFDYRFQPTVFNVSDDVGNFENGFGLNFAKLKAFIDRLLEKKPLEQQLPTTPPPKPPFEQQIPSKPLIKPPLLKPKPVIPKEILNNIINNNNAIDRPNTLNVLSNFKNNQPVIKTDNVFVPIIETEIEIKKQPIDLTKIFETKENVPDNHNICRYDPKIGGSKLYTRTTKIEVSIEAVVGNKFLKINFIKALSSFKRNYKMVK